jgi:hypothetical protein
MECQSQVNAIRKLAVAGEQAGLSLALMIQLLNSGMSVVALLDLITWRLELAQRSSAQDVFPIGSGSRNPAVLRGRKMITVDRDLHFDNIDMEKPDVSSRCSHCGQTFNAEPQSGERVDDVLLRIRAEFNSHQCREVAPSSQLWRLRSEPTSQGQ